MKGIYAIHVSQPLAGRRVVGVALPPGAFVERALVVRA